MRPIALLLALLFAATAAMAAPRFKVATYNVENYLVEASGTRVAKPESHRAKVAETILAIRPDVIAFEEMGRTNSLFELQERLKKGGLELPYWEHVAGHDTNIFVAVLSRFPIVGRHPHTNESFLLDGHRFRTSRGILEIDVEPAPGYRFTLFSAHLKSKRTIADADEGDLREQEAIILRQKIEERLQAEPSANILVCGDFNDTKDSKALKTLVGRNSRVPLTDTRPVERNGDKAPSENPRWEPRHVSWTHFYGKEDTYSRLDYILLNAGMTREWIREGSYLPVIPDWGVGSDHRPVVCEFEAADK